jgi:hypothetical protein
MVLKPSEEMTVPPSYPHRAPFLELRVQRLDLYPTLNALCAGYEQGRWREQALVDHILEWLPEFALRQSELQGLRPDNMVRLLKKAARIIYTTDKYSHRGEAGEILLHIAIRQIFKTIPAITKYY